MSIKEKLDYQRIGRLLRRYVSLNIENMRLSLTERLTLMMGAITIAVLALILGSIGLVFLTAGLAYILKSHMDIQWVYLIVSGIYFGIVAAIFLFRRTLVYNPICKFLSRLIVAAPVRKEATEEVETVEEE